VGGDSLTLLLDTHIVLWWFGDLDRLSALQTRTVTQAEADDERIGVAAITLWEIAKLAERGRIQLTQPVEIILDAIERHSAIDLLPLTARVALESTRLGDRVPSDPTDQLIVATARVHGLRLVTSDDRIRKSGVVPVI
jgi:PIN domain nuclease of toxin-antitoxin system